MRSFKTFMETVDPKFEKAVKTDYHYTGKINGKTWVVPHSFNYEENIGGKVTPMHHHIVVSPNHTIHNNPTLTPEEHARVNAHIKDIHGGQESAKLEEHRYLGFDHKGGKHDIQATSIYDAHLKVVARAKTPKSKDHLFHVHLHTLDTPEGPKEVKHDTMFEGCVEEEYEYPDPKPLSHGPEAAHDYEHQQADQDRRERDTKPKAQKGTPEYQKERDKYRHPALAASRKAATLAFAKKHHIINETKDTMIQEGRPRYGKHWLNKLFPKSAKNPKGFVEPKKDTLEEGPNKKSSWDVATMHQTKIAKQTLRMPVAMTNIMGGPDHAGAREYLKSIGWTDKQIHDHEHYKEESMLKERTLTPAEDSKKEEIVHSMKKKLQGFKARYGDKAKSVMYATATKHAKELAESEQLNEGLHAYKVTHKGKEIDTIFYGSHQDPEDVKRSLVNHDGYHPDIKVTKERKTKLPTKLKESEERFTGRLGSVDYRRNRLKKQDFASDARVAGWMADAKRNKKSDAPGAMMTKDPAPKKLKESEQLDELSKGTLKSYIKKATPILAMHSYMSGSNARRGETAKKNVRGFFNKEAEKSEEISQHREKGIQRAASKLEETSSTLRTVRGVLAETFTRKHFKQVAELIKSHTDANTRQKLADTHAAAFAKDNPKFDHARFHAAAGTTHKKD